MIADRIGRLGQEGAFDVLVRARALEAQGKDVIHLEIGEPDFETPPNVVAAGKRALDEGWTHYGPPQGLPQLREAVAEYIGRTRSVAVSPDNVCVTPGAKPIMFFVMLAVLEPGDEVIYPDPGFPIYESLVRFCRATPKPVPTSDHATPVKKSRDNHDCVIDFHKNAFMLRRTRLADAP